MSESTAKYDFLALRESVIDESITLVTVVSASRVRVPISKAIPVHETPSNPGCKS